MANCSFDFDSVVRATRPQLVRYVSRLVGEADAEDVVQQVLSNAAIALPTYRGEATPRTWLFRIATNGSHDFNRARRKAIQEPLESLDDPTANAVSAEDAAQERQLVREEMSQCIGEVLRLLPESYQSVLALSDCEELSDREVAEVLGVTVGTAKIRLHRARTKMKEALEATCSFYRDGENTLCCDKKRKSTEPAYPFELEPRLQVESRTTESGGPALSNEESKMSSFDSLPIKQRHLIGVGAAIAAGCQPCTRSYVAAAKTEGACDRGVRFALERGLTARGTATSALADFTASTFAQPDLDDAFRAERTKLGALIDVAAAIANNAATSLPAYVDAARALGATEGDLRAAVRIAQTAKQGAESALAIALHTVLGEDTAHSPQPCCVDRPAPITTEPCGCGAKV